MNASAGERERLHHRERLHDPEQELPLVGAVGDHAGPRAEHEHGEELARGHQADGDAVVGEC